MTIHEFEYTPKIPYNSLDFQEVMIIFCCMAASDARKSMQPYHIFAPPGKA